MDLILANAPPRTSAEVREGPGGDIRCAAGQLSSDDLGGERARFLLIARALTTDPASALQAVKERAGSVTCDTAGSLR
jgi:hypothetical protein